MTKRGSWPDDTRGIVDPTAMRRVVDFARYPAGPSLEGIIDWFWSVSWALPDGEVHNQDVLNHPSGHVSAGTLDDAGVPLDPARGRVYGVLTGVSRRRLTVAGWTVAAKTTVGGLGVLIDRPAREITDQELDLAAGTPPGSTAIPGVDGAALVADISKLTTVDARIDRLRSALADAIGQRDPEQVAEARRVAAVAVAAERDRSVCRIEQLAAIGHVSVRTLQRLFDTHVGVGPAWVIRRWRIIEAAEAAAAAVRQEGVVAGGEHESGRGDQSPRWSDLSVRLGYADQSHLIRDFRKHLGTTPADYLARAGAATSAAAEPGTGRP